MSQKQMVLKHLQEHYKITPLQSLKLYGCYRLSSVIFRLRKDGYDIKTIMRTARSKAGEEVNYAEYRLEQDGQKR